jgi:hypothetical protein
MSEDRKTNINNLIIVWQGQSWSAIAPDGRVLGRFPDKREAFEFAKNNQRYVTKDMPANNYLDEDFIEFAEYLELTPPKEKRKRGQTLQWDGELDDSSLVYTDRHSLIQMAVSGGKWLTRALPVAIGVVALVLLVAAVSVISSVSADVGASLADAISSVSADVGASLAGAISSVQAAISNASWVVIFCGLVIIGLGGLFFIPIIIGAFSVLFDLLGDLLQGCLPQGCLSIIGLLIMLAIAFALCRVFV